MGVFAALGEEIGWRGLALSKLQEKHTALIASVIIRIIWGLWHLPMDYIAMGQYELLFIPIFILAGVFFLTAPAIVRA